jgi:lipoate-protein ligase B
MNLATFTPADSYAEIWQLQKELVEKRIRDEIFNTLLIGEHPPVITCGRGTHAENLLTPDIPIVEIERGGDVTYHGPGQLVGYPILKLEGKNRDLHGYLRSLETLLIQTLAEFQIAGSTKPGLTGVWVDDKKIASIGVAVKKWVTYHGFALNVNTDLTQFSTINPCGLSADTMTSMTAILQTVLKVEEVINTLEKHFQILLH